MDKETTEIFQIDRELAEQGVPFHARPSHAAPNILKNKGISCAFNSPRFREATKKFENVFSGDYRTDNYQAVGLIASCDRVKKIEPCIPFGTVKISSYVALGFSSEEEFYFWCRYDDNIVADAHHAFIDIYSLIEGKEQENSIASMYRQNSDNLLTAVVNNLAQSYNTSYTNVQLLCLYIELNLKAALLDVGISENRVRNYKHNLINLMKRLFKEKKFEKDEMILSDLRKFPKYTDSRYSQNKHSRLQIIKLALFSQFVAASSRRRFYENSYYNQFEKIGLPERSYNLDK